MDGLRTLDSKRGRLVNQLVNQKYSSGKAKTRAIVPDFAGSVFTRIAP